jgi:hypothetical protein
MTLTPKEIISADFVEGTILRGAINQASGFDGRTHKNGLTYFIDSSLSKYESFITDAFATLDSIIDLDFEKSSSKEAANIFFHYQYFTGTSGGQKGNTDSRATRTRISEWSPSLKDFITKESYQLAQTDIAIEPITWGIDLAIYPEIKDTTANTILHELAHGLGLRHPNDNPNDPRYTTEDSVLSYNFISTGQSTPFLTLIDIEALIQLWGTEKDDINRAPYGITITTSSIAENLNPGSVVASLATSDSDKDDDFTYSMSDGAGSTDNSSFFVTDNQLRIKETPDFEAKTTYTVRIRSTDRGNLGRDQVFNLRVANLNEAPTALGLSSKSFNENIVAGTTIAILGSTDSDSGDTFSYALVTGTGSTDNSAFSISNNQLKINASPDFEMKPSYSIRLRTTDAGSLSYETAFNLNVNDLPETSILPQGSSNSPGSSGINSPVALPNNGSSTKISNDKTISSTNNSVNITVSVNGNTSAQALAGSLKLEDPVTKKPLPVNGDSAIKTLAQLTTSKPLSDAAKQLLDRYIIKDPSSSSSRKASADDAGFIDFTLKTGSLKSLTAEIALASEVNATAYVKVNPNTGEAYDFTFDPVTGLGAELLDTNKNGLVDSLRIHLQDGARGDVDGVVNGEIRDPGVLAEAPRLAVYRFYRNGVHFYTTNSAERDSVIANSYGKGVGFADLSANPQAKDPLTGGWGYRYEGVAYQALDTQGTALYRFYSPTKGYHFVTTNADEALTVIQNSVGSSYNFSNAKDQKLLDKGWGFQYEETSYKVSTIAQTGMDTPVYRFYNQQRAVHFYSSSMEETKSVIAKSLGAQYATDDWITSTADAIKRNSPYTSPTPLASGWGYQFEGVGWYV